MEEVKDMPEIKLLTHCIQTYPMTIPKAEKLLLYTEEETNWQYSNTPAMKAAEIISPCISPWCAKMKFARKQSRALRMVHQYIPIYSAMIRMSYPMRRIEPILNQQGRCGKWILGSSISVGAHKQDIIHYYPGTILLSSHGSRTYWSAWNDSRLKGIATGKIPAPWTLP